MFLDTPGGRVHRPNHGLAHTLRVANAVKVIADMYNFRLPKDSKIPLIIIQQQQFIALFSVIGRVNEMSAEQSEDYKLMLRSRYCSDLYDRLLLQDGQSED